MQEKYGLWRRGGDSNPAFSQCPVSCSLFKENRITKGDIAISALSAESAESALSAFAVDKSSALHY